MRACMGAYTCACTTSQQPTQTPDPGPLASPLTPSPLTPQQGWARCEVLLVDDRLPRVYARSARVRKELPDYHEALRTAVGVARCMQVGGCGVRAMVCWHWVGVQGEGREGQEKACESVSLSPPFMHYSRHQTTTTQP